MTNLEPDDSDHTAKTRDAYDRLAPVWSATTDDGPFNGGLERPALRSLNPRPLTGSTVLDAGCGSGAQCAWLLEQGADVIGVDLSPPTWRSPSSSGDGPCRRPSTPSATPASQSTASTRLARAQAINRWPDELGPLVDVPTFIVYRLRLV